MQGFPNIGVISECAGCFFGRPAPHVSRGCFGSNMVAVVRLLNSFGRLSDKVIAVKWTRVFGPAGAIAKVDRAGSGAAVMDFPRSAVVQGLMRAFVAIEFKVIDQSLMTIGS